MQDVLSKFIELDKYSRDFGFDWESLDQIIGQVRSECDEIKSAIDHKESLDRIKEEVGDLIQSSIALCLFLGYDAKDIINRANTKYEKRINILKKVAKENNLNTLKNSSTEFSLKLWDKVKEIEKS